LNTKTQRHKDLTKTGGKPLFCKASVLCTAVSGDVHHHSANKDPPQPSLFREGDGGSGFTEKKNRKTVASTITMT